MSNPLVAIVPRPWALEQLASPLMGTGLTADQAMTLATTELAAIEAGAEVLLSQEIIRLSEENQHLLQEAFKKEVGDGGA